MPEEQTVPQEAYKLVDRVWKTTQTITVNAQTVGAERERSHAGCGQRTGYREKQLEAEEPDSYLELRCFLLFCFALEYRAENKMHFRLASGFKSLAPSASCACVLQRIPTLGKEHAGPMDGKGFTYSFKC